MVGEMRGLGDQSPSARDRFLGLRDRAALLLPWTDHLRTWGWMQLGEATRDEAELLMWLAFWDTDPDEATMYPRATYALHRAMVRIYDGSQGRRGRDNAAILKRASFLASPPTISAMPIPDRAKYADDSRRLALPEACRAYAQALSNGETDIAERAAQVVLTVGEQLKLPHARRMLVASALAGGIARPEHEYRLREAAVALSIDPEADPLLARWRSLTKPGPNPGRP